VRVIFSFDYENYINPNADEAGKLYADLLSRHGVRGCFMVVAERARALRARGRLDVIEALRRHEIAYHTDTHDLDPTPTERLDPLDWKTGLEYMLTTEARGIRVVEEIFGQFPSAFTQPGNAWAPQMFVAADMLGIPVMTDSPFEASPGVPLWYCGCLHIDYHQGLERYFDLENRVEAMRRDFQALCETRKDADATIVINTHPTQLTIAQWPRRPPAYLGRSPREVWTPGPARPWEFVLSFLRDLDDYVDFIVRDAKADIITYRELYQQCRDAPRDWLPMAEVVSLARAVSQRLTYQRHRDSWLSPAEVFGLIAHALARYAREGTLPDLAPPRRLLGPVDPPPERDIGRPEVDARLLLQACEDVSWAIERSGCLPGRVTVGGACLGPGQFLGAMSALLDHLWESGPSSRLPDRVLTGELPDLPEIAAGAPFTGLAFKGTWRAFAPSFEGANVLRLARLQSWSARPAAAS